MDNFLHDKLEQRKVKGNLRSLEVNNYLIDFYSNDYLGFSTTGLLFNELKKLQKTESIEKIGSTGSRLISGNSNYIEELECYIADFHNSEAALIYNSGYNANIGLISCITTKQDTIIYDEYIHASIRDGIRLSTSKSYHFKHNDVADLEKKIKLSEGNIFLILESIYSMDGDSPNFKEVVFLCKKYNINLIIDEAHAIGVFGEKGRGLFSNEQYNYIPFARIITYGKAMGAHGAAILGSRLLKEFLVNFSRPFIYTTALPFTCLQTIKASYKLLINSQFQSKLLENIDLFKKLIVEHNLEQYFLSSNSPIQSFSYVSLKENPEKIKAKLIERKIGCKLILSPTVPIGKERLRINIHSFNTNQEMNKLLDVLSTFKTVS